MSVPYQLRELLWGFTNAHNIQCGNFHLPDITRSTVNGINGKQQLRVLRRMLGKRSCSADWRRVTNVIGLNISIKIVWQELHGMGFRCRAAARKPYTTNTTASIRCIGVKHVTSTAGLWSRSLFCGVTNHLCLADWWASLGLADARRTLPPRGWWF